MAQNLYYKINGQKKKFHAPPVKPKASDIQEAAESVFDSHKSELVGIADLDGMTVYKGADNKIHASGGYADGLKYTKETESGYNEIDITWISNKYIVSLNGANLGNFNDASGFGYSFIDVVVGEQYKISGVPYYYMGLWVMYDADGNATQGSLTTSAGNNSETRTEEITIPNGVTKLGINTRSVSLSAQKTVVYKYSNGATVNINISSEDALKSGNILYGKKWVACGDSFTEGDFTNYVDANGKSARESDAFDSEYGHYKTYPYWIGKRNRMNVQWLAKCGSDFTNVSGASNPFSSDSTSNHNYTLISADADYITLMFGLNEVNLSAEEIGTISDTTNATLYGAYNVVFTYILTNMPYAKVGVIIADAWMNATYRNAIIDICKKWGVPYLDLKNSDSITAMIDGRIDYTMSKAKTLRNNAFKISSEDSHPNVKAHEFRSTIIENWLRSL